MVPSSVETAEFPSGDTSGWASGPRANGGIDLDERHSDQSWTNDVFPDIFHSFPGSSLASDRSSDPASWGPSGYPSTWRGDEYQRNATLPSDTPVNNLADGLALGAPYPGEHQDPSLLFETVGRGTSDPSSLVPPQPLLVGDAPGTWMPGAASFGYVLSLSV